MFASIIFLFVANKYYNEKNRERVQAVAENYNKEIMDKAAEGKRIEDEKRAEEQAIYNKNKGKKLIYSPMGDSLSNGSFASTENTKFVAVLSQLIKEKMGYDVQLENGAVKPGSGLKDNGIPNSQKVIFKHPNLVTIEFGTNDSSKVMDNAYSSPEEFKVRLSNLIDSIKSNADTKIILVTTWKSGYPVYDDIIKSVGEEKNIPVADISPIWHRNDTFGPEGRTTFIGKSDNWHPNDLGHKLIAETIFDKAYEILK